MRTIVHIVAAMSWGLAVLAGLATFLIMVLIATDVVLRFMGSGVSGTLEIVTYYLMLVVAFLSVARVEQRDGMISVDALYDNLGQGSRRWVFVFATLVTAVVYAAVAFASLQEALKQFASGAYAITLNYILSIWPAYFIVPVAFAVAAATAGLRAVLAVMLPRAPADLREQMGLAKLEAGGQPFREDPL